MDVVPNSKDFLDEFIAGLESEESEEMKVKESDVWIDIEAALQHWMVQILDAESHLEKKADFRERIEASLRRQQIEGFLNHHDIVELQRIANLWSDLLNYNTLYTIGCQSIKRDIVSCLLQLHEIHQISDNLFIEACLKL